MARCPVCESVRVVIVLGATPKAFCGRCGSRWLQEGSVQRAIHRGPGRPRRAAPAAPA